MGRQQFDEFIHVGAQQRAAAEADPGRMSFEEVRGVEHDQVSVGQRVDGQSSQNPHP